MNECKERKREIEKECERKSKEAKERVQGKKCDEGENGITKYQGVYWRPTTKRHTHCEH